MEDVALVQFGIPPREVTSTAVPVAVAVAVTGTATVARQALLTNTSAKAH